MTARLVLRILSATFFLLGAAFVLSNWRYARSEQAWKELRAAVRADDRICRQSIQDFERLETVLGANPTFIRDYARCLREAGEGSHSTSLLMRAATRQKDPRILEHLADILAREGDYPGAIEAARAAGRMSPWRLTSQWQLASFHFRHGLRDAAFEYARRILITPTRMLRNQALTVKDRSRKLMRSWKASPQWTEEIRPTLDLVDPQWHPGLTRALWVAGPNASEIRGAFDRLSPQARPNLSYLVAHMPEPDLAGLTAEFLVSHVRSAMDARQSYPFAKDIPDELFRLYVLPYYQLGERREEWRESTRKRVSPYLEGIRKRHVAIQALAEAFPVYGVEYDTVFFGVYRARSLSQTLTRGHGDCFDGAVFFANVLRSVGIPARVVAIPRWYGGRGGHAWVEAYENELWRPIGVFDPPETAGWFLEWTRRTDASKAEHRIFAASFERTEITIPTFGPHVWWNDVTDRYVPTDPLPFGPLEP